MDTPSTRYHVLAVVGLLLAGALLLQGRLPDWGRCAVMLLALAGAYRLADQPWSKTVWWSATAFCAAGLVLSVVTLWS